MATIRIYRTESADKRPETSKAKRDEIRERVAALSRVDRPEIMDHFLATGRGASDFYKQQALPASVVNNPAERRFRHSDKGWTVPEGSLGRKGAQTIGDADKARSTAESLRIWINKHLGEAVAASHLAVVVDD
jgi:hypothetical protein